ncbi:MAG: 2-amino-4-hydroxy-6-hydroxymethyldihydropteridine diphosphokinase [Candidatus Omnitrophica bacterium]|nr:2-amino-4-hydroxy-6-hydroxymethyldihydropteridine diphosphokinase [Candidatus Omnitrophota bacterium]MBU3933626.1 2-amino-4-hydroxy-6-hydroxymethyldihydropteridine diphosphokinase [Candidatus Omnitrophota bacterium]MBU4140725.1 2-amino-4-hydroxy-6-hydroxymethyldihydropteridine diphosphokinase [Candidatus Omnitrophota bacterium]
MVTCYIALGSNAGDRSKNIKLALEYLKLDPAIKALKVSSLIETEPSDCLPQSKFLNGVVKLETGYSAQELLKRLQEIEVRLGREILRPKNHPRTIDLDILLYGDLKIDEEGLKIPHPRMREREFVTLPLREIAPELLI